MNFPCRQNSCNSMIAIPAIAWNFTQKFSLQMKYYTMPKLLNKQCTCIRICKCVRVCVHVCESALVIWFNITLLCSYFHITNSNFRAFCNIFTCLLHCFHRMSWLFCAGKRGSFMPCSLIHLSSFLACACALKVLENNHYLQSSFTVQF